MSAAVFVISISMAVEKKYKSFWSFYPYYLAEHEDATNRGLHFIGTASLIILLIAAIALQTWWLLALVPLVGYSFAWAGHYFIEKNKPATFTYPLYSLAGDFVMFWHTLTGQLNEQMKKAHRTIQNDHK